MEVPQKKKKKDRKNTKNRTVFDPAISLLEICQRKSELPIFIAALVTIAGHGSKGVRRKMNKLGDWD